MRLADFIRSNREAILAEWEAFARTCTPASTTMDITALRDHAGAMLKVIADDLDTPQDGRAQALKSWGRAPHESEAEPTAAAEHGVGRSSSGFAVEQMVAEYRALRASVIRLWTASRGRLEQDDILDLTRFNEAIDQSLAESVVAFNENVEQSKEIFIGMLGHDLRTPLGAILTSAQFLHDVAGTEHRHVAARIVDATRRTTRMVGDLLDFTRSRLGDGIPVVRQSADAGDIVREVVAEFVAWQPHVDIRISVNGDVSGEWDVARLNQALANVIGNAIQHGSGSSPVLVSVDGDDGEVNIAVHNQGDTIGPEQLDGLFNPLRTRAPSTRRTVPRGPTDSLGLGLYIAERIMGAHGGATEVVSVPDDGTTFTLRLPRRAESQVLFEREA